MMLTVVSILTVAASAIGAEWVIDGWLGEERRYWVGLGGFGLLVVAGALVKASGIDAVTRYLRNALIGAGLGAALKRVGLRAAWLRKGLRIAGIETEPDTRPEEARRGHWISPRLLWSGWVASLVGLGMIWAGFFNV